MMSTTTEITLETKIIRSDSLLSSDLDNETVMMDIEKGDYYGLDEVGAKIWALAEKSISVRAICLELEKAFDVEQDQCLQDVSAFISDLAERKIVEICS